ncbi:MAG: class I SAM-dependent methyltransferase [Chitinophagaceae bacterium]|nr:class I SAM-dependent methyltransferase [Rubrivivax sp.]
MATPPLGDKSFDPCLRFDDGADYETMMGRWSVLVAAPFLNWLALPQGLDWLDDGCGNGVFSEVLMSRQGPRSVVGADPSSAQLAFARQRPGAAGVRFIEGDAQALPLPNTCVDAAVMALVLFFLPDPARGLQEMLRVVRPGGTIAAYHWDMAHPRPCGGPATTRCPGRYPNSGLARTGYRVVQAQVLKAFRTLRDCPL